MNFYDVEAEFYDLFYFSFDRDIEVYRRHLCPRVLELFTGTGRILHHLHPEYCVGIDVSEKMLEIAERNLRGINHRLVRGDARNFKIDEKFCLVIIGLNSLMMFPREERIEILKNAARHLDDGGKVIVDILNPYMMVEDIVHHGDTVEKDGVYYSRFFVPRWRGDHWDILYFYDIVEGDAVRRKYANLNLYPVYYDDLLDESRSAGLKIIEVYGDYGMHEFSEDSERIIAVMVREDGGSHKEV